MSVEQQQKLRAALAAYAQKQQRDFDAVLRGDKPVLEFLGLTAEDAPKLVGFALQQLDEGDLDTAEAAAELAVACGPKSFEAWMTLGATRARQKQEKKALEAYAKAAELRQDDVRLWCDVGELKLMLLDYSAAATALKMALDLDPQGDTPAGRRAQALVAKTYAKIQQAKK